LIHLASFVGGSALWQAWPFLPRIVLAALLLALVLLSLRKQHRTSLMLIAGFALAMLRAPAPVPDSWHNPVVLSGYFSEPARHFEKFDSQPFVPDRPPPGAPGLFNVLSTASGADPEGFRAGTPYTLKLRMTAPRKRRNPGAWDSGLYARLISAEPGGTAPGISLPRRIASLREEIGEEIDSRMEPGEAALVKAVTVGLRDTMPQELRQDFRRSGLSHILSISGTHFGFFAVALFFVIKTALEMLPHSSLLRMSMHISAAQAAALLTLPLMLFYLALSGGSTPSVRAFVMISLFLCGLLLGSRGCWQSFLAAAAFVLVLMDPSVVTTLSFLMSFSAVLFIGLALRRTEGPLRAEREEPGMPARIARLLVTKPLSLTLAATFGVLPFVIHWFHEVSLISPLANIAVTGIAGLLLIPLSIAGAVAYAAVGSFVTAPVVSPLASLCLTLAHTAGAQGWASTALPGMPAVMIPIYFACTLPWFITRDRRLMPLLLVPFLAYGSLALYSSHNRDVTLTLLETGRSDAMVMELPGNRAVVIDTGSSGTEVSAYLRARGLTGIEALVLTHSHHDHTGGAGKLVKQFKVKEAWDNGRLKRKNRRPLDGIPIRHLARGDTVELAGVKFKALHPYLGYESEEGGTRRTNNDSLVMRAEVMGGSSVLLTGDAQADAVAALGMLEEEEHRSEVLKAPHHGKQPEVVRKLVSMAKPSRLVLTGYDAKGLDGLPLMSTGDCGAIKVDLSSSPPKVKTFVEFAPVLDPGTFRDELHNLATLFTVW